MGEMMPQKIDKLGNTTLGIISSTVVVLPFIMFLKLGSSHQLLAILPFVIFYTFRMTGIFFIRGIKTTLNSYTLLKLAIYCGVFGSLLGVIGVFWRPVAIAAGVFLGMSAAWLPTAQATIKYYRRENDLAAPKSVGISLLSLALLGGVLFLPGDIGFVSFFSIYLLMYLLALPTLNKITYQVTADDLEGYSPRYLIIFGVFFGLIFSLRSSRLLANVIQFDYFIEATILAVLGLLASEIFANKYVRRRLSQQLNYLTVLNGAVGNYLFLFSSLYVAGYYGHRYLFMKFYLPYILGLVLAPKLVQKIGINSKQIGLLGMFLGLLVVVVTPFFAVGVLILTTFKGVLNHWLTDNYMQEETLPADKRIWVKYSIQSIGSILHQFILMLIGSLLVFENHAAITQFFIITSQKTPTLASQSLMQQWNNVASAILLLAIGAYFCGQMVHNKRV